MVTDFYELWDQQKQAQHTHTAAPAGPASPFNGTDHPYALAALRAECDDLADLPPDSRRNQTLNDAAFKMARHVGAGSINASTVRAGLEAAARACQLPQAEIDTVLRDHGALQAGQAHPRSVPASNGRTSWAPSGAVPSGGDTKADPMDRCPQGSEAEPQDHTSWWPKDLAAILDGSEPEQPPTHLLRDDGKALLYPGTVNGLIGESESGKAQPLTARIVTPSGWTTIGSLTPGSTITGIDGQAQKVEAIYDRGERQVWEVKLSDGTIVECCDEHLWTVQDVNDRHRRDGYRTLTTADIAGRVRWRRGAPRWHLPTHRAVEFEHGPALPLDPYLIGLLLGDGGITRDIMLTSADDEIHQAAADLVPAPVIAKRASSSKLTVYLTTARGQRNPLLDALRELDMMGRKAEAKHVPREYMRASAEDRLALLQGLLDTDGGIDRRIVSYSTVSAQLAEDVAELVRSLGGAAKTDWRVTRCNGKDGQPSARISIRMPLNVDPFRLSRKLDDYRAHVTRREPQRHIVSVTPTDRRAPMRCIAVSNSDHLYLTEGYAPTHNTWVAMLLVAQRLAAGMLVAYMDFEDVARNVIARLRLLGVTDEQFAQFRYIGPDETLHEKAFTDLQGVLASSPDTIVVDGFNAAMTLLGLALESNQDATKFFQSFLNMCAASGACVVYVDHVPKNKEQRGKGGIGAQAKRAMTKGAAYIVEIVKPFGRGMSGTISLDVDKDSAGHVRGYSAGSRAGIVHLDSSGNDGVVMRIEVPAGAVQDSEGNVPPWRPTYLMERVSKFLETLPDGAGGEAIQRELGGNRDALKKATNFLVDDGYATRATGDRGAVITKIVRAYRQPAEQSDDPFNGVTSTTSTAPQPDLNRARCETTPVDLNQTMPPPTGAWLRSEGSTGGAGKAAKVRHLNRVDDVVVNPHTGEIINSCASCGEPMATVEAGQKTHPGCGAQ